jgi:hypothetical protein
VVPSLLFALFTQGIAIKGAMSFSSQKGKIPIKPYITHVDNSSLLHENKHFKKPLLQIKLK